METVTLTLALLGLNLAICAIGLGLKVALTPQKPKTLPDGLYQMRKISGEGLDTIYEITSLEEKDEA